MFQKGYKMSEEHKRKIGLANKNKPHLKGRYHPMYGKTHSKQVKQRLREAGLNNWKNPKYKQYMSEIHKGKGGKNSPSWKGGKPFCLTCKKQLSTYKTKVCRHCYNKFRSSYLSFKRYKNTQGYILLRYPSHPYCNNDGYIREHRYCAEAYLGRFLEPEEAIHHINGIKDDNRPENLYLFSSEKEHQKYHQKEYPLKSNLL